MKEINIIRENNLMINFRTLKVFVDNKFYDFIEPNEKVKTFVLDENINEIEIKLDWCQSNIININNTSKSTYSITSQIQNGLFILIFSSFFLGGILKLIGLINIHLCFGLQLPLIIIVYYQTVKRKTFLKIIKKSQFFNSN